MKFYDCATAPSPRRVRIFAAERALTSMWNNKVEQHEFLARARLAESCRALFRLGKPLFWRDAEVPRRKPGSLKNRGILLAREVRLFDTLQ